MSHSAALVSTSPKAEVNSGTNDAASAKSTLSILKQLRADSSTTGFLDFYSKVWDQVTGEKPPSGFLDYPLRFILRIVIVLVGIIFFNDCQAEPMLPIFLIVNGVCGLSIQIVEEIAGSLLKDHNSTWKKVKDAYSTLLEIFMCFWFFSGCVWLYRMPLPNMTPTTNALNALVAPEKYCAFPVYGLAVFRVLSLPVVVGGYFVIVTVTAVVLYVLPKVENVENMDIADDDAEKKKA